jgi:hypothetical protein
MGAGTTEVQTTSPPVDGRALQSSGGPPGRIAGVHAVGTPLDVAALVVVVVVVVVSVAVVVVVPVPDGAPVPLDVFPPPVLDVLPLLQLTVLQLEADPPAPPLTWLPPPFSCAHAAAAPIQQHQSAARARRPA